MHNTYCAESEDTLDFLYKCTKLSKLLGNYYFKGTRSYQDPADLTQNVTALTEDTHLHRHTHKRKHNTNTQGKHWATKKMSQLPIHR